MPRQSRVEAPTFAELETRVRTQFGGRARILKAEKITDPGVLGLFARTRFVATVEVPDELPLTQAASFDLPARVGIAALLAQASAGDTIDEPGPPADFEAELAQVTEAVQAQEAAAPSPAPTTTEEAPNLREAPGDLIALVGIDTAEVAATMAARTGARIVAVTDGGLWDRRSAMLTRADGVRAEQPTIATLTPEGAERLAHITPDQVWVAVDAGRKAQDTQHWVDQVAEHAEITAVAVSGEHTTSSPHTAWELGIPVGWTSDGPAST